MAILRRKCKLTNSDYADVDLRLFEKTIIDTINNTVPRKNPKVYKGYFSTDVLSQSEAVTLGRALAKVKELKEMGKTVTTFRIFDGKVCSEEVKDNKRTGGRMK